MYVLAITISRKLAGGNKAWLTGWLLEESTKFGDTAQVVLFAQMKILKNGYKTDRVLG